MTAATALGSQIAALPLNADVPVKGEGKWEGAGAGKWPEEGATLQMECCMWQR